MGGSNVEEEVANNDVGVVGVLVGWREELEYGAGKEDVVLKLKSSKEEGEVEQNADDSELPLSMGDELDSSKGIEEEADRREDVAEKVGSMMEELSVELSDELKLESPEEEKEESDDVEMYAVALLTSTSAVLV
ncbi:hypothetical protein KC315_g10803 [Hortaea werneckii]|nr:hypothetical protein KC315_g10803 [Hortaea werneckii]